MEKKLIFMEAQYLKTQSYIHDSWTLLESKNQLLRNNQEFIMLSFQTINQVLRPLKWEKRDPCNL